MRTAKNIGLFLTGLAAVFGSSCTNTTLIGHERAYDLNVELKADVNTPVALNVGFESYSGAVVPPKTPRPLEDLFSSVTPAEGDALPTLTRLKIKKIDDVGIDFVSATATGRAAIAATRNGEKRSEFLRSERYNESQIIGAMEAIVDDDQSIAFPNR